MDYLYLKRTLSWRKTPHIFISELSFYKNIILHTQWLWTGRDNKSHWGKMRKGEVGKETN